ncbi:hypothetical protein RchiOBHm_Chr7g0206861 [Rosa chinensis]|uniref:Uncharacterized protein n=1 Tax=Rosa chinensis TaxID=74649 RepID=A0A2P6P9B9_ROSCH|nr:hypothetical protein RchiOBHm_Chr7g0206861 [Rosa chinensis]
MVNRLVSLSWKTYHAAFFCLTMLLPVTKERDFFSQELELEQIVKFCGWIKVMIKPLR